MSVKASDEELVRKTLDIPAAELDALAIEGIKHGFRKVKPYLEKILIDHAKPLLKKKRDAKS